jgi:endonuclease/exonuclease/phosphatase family metal-dependent hydrolase
MKLKVLFWNIWLENQLKGIDRSDKLLEELAVIITTYNPDCIGLNEVLRHNEHKIPLVNSLLQSHGYIYHYFSHSSPFTSDWDIGSAICSKVPLKYIEEIELGRNATAEKKGHTNFPVKAVAAKLDISEDLNIGIIVAHPINLKPSTIKDHFGHTRNLSNFIKNSSYKHNTIIGGDFNEPMYFPRSFKRRTADHLHHKTGSKRNPTWRHNTWRKTPLRANLDKLFWTKNGALELTEFKVIESHVSDHRPLFAEFQIHQQ